MNDDAEDEIVTDRRSREVDRIRAAYAIRKGASPDRYTREARAERHLLFDQLLTVVFPEPRRNLRFFEVACGSGSDLEKLIELGADPARCSGIELLGDRFETGKSRLPAECNIRLGYACRTGYEPEQFDVDFASTVFTSILDGVVQTSLANEMWRLARPGGSVLWYEFTHDSPRDPDVQGVYKSRVQALFSEAEAPLFHRVTLAPPIGRRISWAGSFGYRPQNSLPMRRTHPDGWHPKPHGQSNTSN